MGSQRPPVLMYHSTADLEYDPNMLCTSPERFEAQMVHLKESGLRGVSMRELLHAMSAGEATMLVGLTFDDGYKDFADTAVPVLERFGFSATVFAVVGMLGEENRWEHAYYPRPPLELLDAEGLREVAARGMEVGSHSMTHPDLSGLEPEQLEREIGASRRILSEMLGREVEGFCYPYGSYDAAAVQATRRAGYGYGCGWTTRVENSVYDLPRIPVSDRDSPFRIQTKLKIYPQYAEAKRLLSGVLRLKSASDGRQGSRP